MKTLKPLINSLIKLIEKGTDFVKGQVPEVAQQILAFKKMEAIFEVVFFGLLVLALSTGLVTSASHGCEAGVWVFLVADIIAAIVFVIALYGTGTTLLQIKYAPKIFLLEYLKNLLSNEEN